jgi:hypothetical protein
MPANAHHKKAPIDDHQFTSLTSSNNPQFLSKDLPTNALQSPTNALQLPTSNHHRKAPTNYHKLPSLPLSNNLRSLPKDPSTNALQSPNNALQSPTNALHSPTKAPTNDHKLPSLPSSSNNLRSLPKDPSTNAPQSPNSALQSPTIDHHPQPFMLSTNHHSSSKNDHHQSPLLSSNGRISTSSNDQHKSTSAKLHHQSTSQDHLSAIAKNSPLVFLSIARYQARVMSRLQGRRGANPAAIAIHQAAIAKNSPLVFLLIAQYRARVISRLQSRLQSPGGANVGQGAPSSLKVMSRQRKRNFTKCSFTSALPCNDQNKRMACGASIQRHHREVMVKCKQCSVGAGYPVYRCCRCYGLLGNAISKKNQLMGGKGVRMYPIPALETLLETPWMALSGVGTRHDARMLLKNARGLSMLGNLRILNNFCLQWNDGCPSCFQYEFKNPPPAIGTLFSSCRPSVEVYPSFYTIVPF